MHRGFQMPEKPTVDAQKSCLISPSWVNSTHHWYELSCYSLQKGPCTCIQFCYIYWTYNDHLPVWLGEVDIQSYSNCSSSHVILEETTVIDNDWSIGLDCVINWHVVIYQEDLYGYRCPEDRRRWRQLKLWKLFLIITFSFTDSSLRWGTQNVGITFEFEWLIKHVIMLECNYCRAVIFYSYGPYWWVVGSNYTSFCETVS